MSFTLYYFNSKWIKDLIIRPDTLKLVKERAGDTLEQVGKGNEFLNRTQMAQQLRERIDIQLKNFCIEKKQSLDCRGSPQNRGEYLLAMHLTRVQLPEYTGSSKNLTSPKSMHIKDAYNSNL
jgi:hypothetical protein